MLKLSQAADVAGDLGAAGATGPAGENLLNRFGRLQPRYDMTNTNNFLEDTEMQKRYLGNTCLLSTLSTSYGATAFYLLLNMKKLFLIPGYGTHILYTSPRLQ